MAAPVNVKLANPTISLASWNATEWNDLNAESSGNPDFYPLTVKVAYVVGIIHDLCESVSALLGALRSDTSLIPAYGIFASGVELLGRCLEGNETTENAVRNLKVGFNWLADLTIDDSDSKLVMQTTSRAYTVAELSLLRHFAAHGQATVTRTISTFDEEILEPMPALLARGMEAYWAQLLSSDDFCNNLAKANVIALRSWPVLRSWSLLEWKPDGTYDSLGQVFSKFSWRVRPG